jgi:hypothetical protein
MSITLDLPDELVRRLKAEASRQGVQLAIVIADLAAHLPAADRGGKRRLAFVAAGASASGITHRMDDLLADGFGRD